MKARTAATGPGTTAPGMCGARFNMGRIRFGGYPLSLFAKAFSPYDGRTVIDRTGLTGSWDFELTFAPDQVDPASQTAAAIDPDAPTLPTAMQEQLGLRLEPTKGMIEVLIVERVERPSDN